MCLVGDSCKMAPQVQGSKDREAVQPPDIKMVEMREVGSAGRAQSGRFRLTLRAFQIEYSRSIFQSVGGG